MEKMLVTQALDERDLLKKKIFSKIDGVHLVSTMRHNEKKATEGSNPFFETKKEVFCFLVVEVW